MKQKIKQLSKLLISKLHRGRIRIKFQRKIEKIIKENIILKEIDLKEIKRYWKLYDFKINTSWHEAYISVNNKYDVRYIPEYIYYQKIEPVLNDQRFLLAYTDKNIYSQILKGIKLPETIIKNINDNYFDENDVSINANEVKNLILNSEDELIIKPSIATYGGKNVGLIKIKNSKIYLNDKKITFNNLIKMYKTNFCIQKLVKQYHILNDVHPYSLNKICIMTYRDKTSIKTLASVIRFGNKKSIVDNGGISCGVDNLGNLNSVCIDKSGKKYKKHPYTNVDLAGIKIPQYEKVHELLKKAHKQLYYFDLVSWDVAINQKGEPIIIEFNVGGQEINFHQFNNGPLFGNQNEEVLKRIKNTKMFN